MRLGVYVSGNGSNLQAIIDAIKNSYLKNIEVVVVISNNKQSNALLRASKNNIPTYYIDSRLIDTDSVRILQMYKVDLIVLAGFLKLIGPRTLKAYKGKIINIHPALLPRHSGAGMYGNKVHEKVLASKDQETGVTIHFVDKEYDAGKVIKQVRIPVYSSDTVESLSSRVLKMEHKILIEYLAEYRSDCNV